MATAVARKACLPAGVTLAKAWSVVPPPMRCSQAEPDVACTKHLPSEAPSTSGNALSEAQAQHISRTQADKSFKMHIGANLHIPTKSAKERPQYSHPLPADAQKQQQGVVDPFEGLPFRGFAEKMGAAVMPTLQAARDAERQAKLQAKKVVEEAEVVVPEVPHVLPFTRWAAGSQQFRSTFIADPPKDRKKARLSWYHPDDTMVPRDWFKGGLLEDIKYYMPFGLGASSSSAAGASAATA